MKENTESGTKKGRPSSLRGLSRNKAKLAYEYNGGSIRATAKALGVDRKALTKFIKEHDIKPPAEKTFRAGDIRCTGYDGKITKWIKDHPMSRFPYNYKEISRIIGASPEAARHWYARERERVKELAESIPDLRDFNFPMKDEKNRFYVSAEMKSYRYHIHPWTFETVIIGQVQSDELDNTKERRFPVDNLKMFASRVNRHIVKETTVRKHSAIQESGQTPDPSKS